MIKWIAIILTSLGMLVGGVFFLEDRYFNTSEAVEMGERIEKESVKTFQQQQEYVDLQALDIWKDRLNDVERKLEKSPSSTYLKNQYEKIKEKIKRIEDRLFGD